MRAVCVRARNRFAISDDHTDHYTLDSMCQDAGLGICSPRLFMFLLVVMINTQTQKHAHARARTHALPHSRSLMRTLATFGPVRTDQLIVSPQCDSFQLGR